MMYLQSNDLKQIYLYRYNNFECDSSRVLVVYYLLKE